MSSSSDEDYRADSEDDFTSDDDDYSNTDESDSDEPLQFGEWQVISNPFNDKRNTDIFETNLPHEFHPAIDINSPMSMRECFEAFISPQIVEYLCQWTNERAEMFLEAHDNLALKIHGLYWRNVAKDEMYVFISLVLMMGLVHLPDMHDYWRKTYLLGGPPIFSAEIMSRDR